MAAISQKRAFLILLPVAAGILGAVFELFDGDHTSESVALVFARGTAVAFVFGAFVLVASALMERARPGFWRGHGRVAMTAYGAALGLFVGLLNSGFVQRGEWLNLSQVFFMTAWMGFFHFLFSLAVYDTHGFDTYCGS